MDSDSPSTTKDASETSGVAESHKNEGFLKAAWHKLTHHQHDNMPPEESAPHSKAADKPQEEEPKKASGLGSGSG